MSVGFMRKQAHVLMKGRVQGIFFRAFVRQQAEALGLSGWVRNTPDGRVEAVFSGEKDKIKEMIEKCRHGPPLAKVTEVEVSWQKPKEFFSGFEIRR